MEGQEGHTTDPPSAACPPHDPVDGSRQERDRRVSDRYMVQALLGRGGMANVYRGRDTRLDRPVAIKRMRSDLAADPKLRVRFRREARSVAQLDHPSIVAVYDTGSVADPGVDVPVPFIVMELVEGQTVLELLQQRRSLTPEFALTIAAAVLDALAYSHASGVVHRDIKPANVMVTNEGRVKVTDFGIAHIVPHGTVTATQPGAVMGTPLYMSPEQLRGESTDARSDIYSVGCLLFQLLTGRPPFVGDSPLSIACQHVTEEPAPPSKHDPTLPTAIDAVVATALAKTPSDRYQTAMSMKADIDAIREQLAGNALEQVRHDLAAPTNPPTGRERRRLMSPLLVGTVVFALLACGVGLVVDQLGPEGTLASALVAAAIRPSQPLPNAPNAPSVGSKPAAHDNSTSSQRPPAPSRLTTRLQPVEDRPPSRGRSQSARHDESAGARTKIKPDAGSHTKASTEVKAGTKVKARAKRTSRSEDSTKGKAHAKEHGTLVRHK
jgi:serine/threonine protein kinase